MPSPTSRLRDLLEPEPELTASERLRIAFDLHETGVAMMRLRVERENPTATDNEVEATVREWLQSGPVTGEDAVCRPVPWPSDRT